MSTRQIAVPTKRRVGALTANGLGVVIDQAMPGLTIGSVLVRVTRSMVSAGTHLGRALECRQKNLNGEREPMGYQCAGEVAALGPGVSRFQVGDRVAGFGGTALHAEWNVIPQSLCSKIPDNVSDDQACGLNLVLTAIQANRRAEPVFGEYFLVVGMGIVGQLCAQIAQIAGCYTMGWDTMPKRLEVARQCGIAAVQQVPAEDTPEACRRFTAGCGFDAAIMAFGGDGSQAINDVTHVMKITRDNHRMGRIVLVGGLSTQLGWGAALGNLDLRSSARTGAGYHDREWETGQYEYPPVFMRWTTASHLDLALRWISEGKLKIDPLITHHFALDEFEEAVGLLVDRPEQALGVVIDTHET